MELIKDKVFDEERALYGKKHISVSDCRFDGPADGESAFKEAKDVQVENCYFNLRYPFWHNDSLKITDSEMTVNCRAPLWYTTDANIHNSTLHGVKALRECKKVTVEGCDVVSPEFGWFCDSVTMRDSNVTGEYFMLRASKLNFNGVKLKGKYSFQYIEDSVFENCDFDTKDALWHAKRCVVRNSTINGEYLAWYCEDVTFENCKIIGTQPLCYCKGLTLINCEMIDCDLSFEKSDVNATLTAPILSIKNPASGSITVPDITELIMDDTDSSCIITRKK